MYIRTRVTRAIKKALALSHHRGLLIALEGADGAGKTTLARNIETDLNTSGVNTLYVRNPGCDEVTNKIRDITKSYNLDWFTGCCLFMASLKQMMDNVVIPALREDKVVILDRFIRSTYIYQAFNHQFAGEKKRDYNKRLKMFKDMVNYCIAGTLESTIFYEFVILLPAADAFKRIMSRNKSKIEDFDVFESNREYFYSIHDAYLQSMNYYDDPVCLGMQNNTVLDGNLSKDDLLTSFYASLCNALR